MPSLPNLQINREYLSGFISVGVIQGGFMFFNYLARLILANHLEPDDYGRISYYLSLINFFVIVVLLGRSSFISRELIRLSVSGKFNHVRKLLKNDVLKVAAAWLAASLLLFAAVQTRLVNFETNTFLLLSAIVLFIALGTYRQGIQRAFGQIRISQIPEKTAYSILYISALSAALFIFDLDLTVLQILGIIAASHLLAQVLGYVLFKILPLTIPRHSHDSVFKKHPGSAVLYLISVLDILDSNLDYYMLEYFSGYESLAVYSVSKQLSLLTFTVIYVSSFVIGPQISKLFYSNKIKELQASLQKTVRLNMILATAVTVVLLALKDPLLQLFGTYYAMETGFTLYGTLLAAQWLNVSLGIPAQVLSSTGHEKYVLYVLAGTVLLQLSAGYFVITNFGVSGMAALFLIASLLLNIVLHLIVSKKLNIRLLG